MSSTSLTAARPTATPWDPSQGHIKGAAYEWDYAFDRSRNPLAQMPSWTTHAVAPLPSLAGGTAKAPYVPPGFPTAINAQSLLGQTAPGQDFWADPGQPGSVLMGASLGNQRGGFTNEGLATLPLNLPNAPMYFREGALALLTSALGGGYTQQADGSEGPGTGTVIDNFIGGVKNIANMLMGPLNAISDFDRQLTASTRVSMVADLYAQGRTMPTIIDGITSFLAGPTGNAGAWKFELNDLTANMAAKGYQQDEAIAELYDMDIAIVREIAAHPEKYRAVLGQMSGPGTAPWDLAAGMPYSTDPAVNMAVEAGHFLSELALPLGAFKSVSAFGRGLATGLRGAEAVTATSGPAGAFARGLSGFAGQQGASTAARAAGIAGRASRVALRASAINNAAGMSIRGFEWTVKQIAGISGNHELANTMDRLLWEMPLSLNPGLNLMASFTSHPWQTGKALLRGRIPIGRPRTAGRVGSVDFAKLGVVGDDGAYLTIAGRPVTLIPTVRKSLGTLREMTLDNLHDFAFRELGWDTGLLRTYFGEGNRFGVNINKLKDGVFYAYLQAARERFSSAAALIEGSTLPERADGFFDRFAPKVYDMIQSDLVGTTHYLRDTFKGQFWDIAARGDTRMGALKASVGDWDPQLALADFASWIRASGHVNTAYAERALRFEFQPRYRKDIAPDAIEDFRRRELAAYRPDEVVSLHDLNALKRTAGLIETRGAGSLLIRRPNAPYSFTRRQVEQILDSVLAEYARESDGGAHPRFYSAEERAAAVGEEAAPAGEVQYGPPSEVAEARVTGMDINTIRLIRQAEALPPEARALLHPNRELMIWFDRWANPGSRGASESWIAAMMSRDRAALWQDIIDAWQARRDLDIKRSLAYDQLGTFAETMTQRAAETGLLADADAVSIVEAVHIIQDNLANPVGMTEQYLQRIGPNRSLRGPIAEPADYTLRAGHEGGINVHEDPVSTWMATHEGIAEMWRKGEEDAFAIANAVEEFTAKINEHLAGIERYREVPMQRVMSIDQPEIRAFPVTMGDTQIKQLMEQIRRTADAPAASAADRALLLDPSGHPLSKLPIVERIQGEGELHQFTPRSLDELLSADAEFARRRQGIEDMTGLLAQASRKLSLEGDWSPRFREAHERIAAVADHVEEVLPEHLRSATVREQAARNVAAQRTASLADQDVARLEQSRSVVGLATGAFGPETTVRSGIRGKPAAEAAVAEMRAADPASSYRWAATRNGWYEIRKAEPVAAPELYHGGPVAFESPLEGRLDSRSLLGPGLYLTDNRSIAEGYARTVTPPGDVPVPAPGVQTFRPTRALTLLDADSPAPPPVVDIFRRVNKEIPGPEGIGSIEMALSMMEEGKSYLAAYRVFSSELRQSLGIEPFGIADSGALQAFDEIVRGVQDSLRALGYDGLRHVGGLITGEPKHNVTVLLGEDIPATRALIPPRIAATGPEGAIETQMAAGNVEVAQAANLAEEALRGGWENPPAGQRIDLADVPRGTSPGVYGGTTRFPDLRTFDPRRKVEARYRVVEAADLRTSTEPGYRTELQPRARVDRRIVDQMVAQWDNEAAFRSESGAHGPPVVDPSLDVGAGNHRVIAMRELSPEQKLAYRAELRNRAESLGLDPAAIDAMTEPILVREVADMTPELARALNTETRAMGAAEIARASARAITPEDLKALDVGAKASIDAALQTAAGADIIRRIVGDLPPNEMARYVNETGGVTAEGIALTRNALLMRTLPGQYDLVRGWIEDPASRQSIEAIVTGVENALPQLAEMDSLIGFGQRHDVIGETLGDAIRRVKQAREDRGVKQAERTEALRSGLDVPPLAGHLAATLDQLNGGEVTTYLRGMAEKVIRDEGNDPSQATMFGQADPRDLLASYLDAGADAVNDARSAKAQGSMFGWQAIDHFPRREGAAHYDYAGPAGEQRTMTERAVITPEVGIIEATASSPATVHSGPLEAMPEGATHWSPQNAAEEGYARALGYAGRGDLIRDAAEIVGSIADETDYLRLIRTVDATTMTPAEYAALRSLSRVVRWTPEGEIVPDFVGGRILPRLAAMVSEDAARLAGKDILPAGDLGAGEATLLAHDPRVELAPAVSEMIGGVEPPVVATLRESAAAGRHTITTDTGAARTVAGAARASDTSPRLNEFNQPTVAARAAAIDTQLTIARARAEAAHAALEAAPAPEGPPPIFGDDLDMATLFDRYWNGESGVEPRPPQNAWAVVDALENLDRGVPSGGLGLTEMERLREALHGWLDRYITNKEATAPRSRAKPPGEILPPDQLHREVNDVLVGLSRVVLDDPNATPLHGFEGTQYEYGPLPSDLGMPPRLILDDFLDRADRVIPGLAAEVLSGRKARWETRLVDAVFRRSLLETLPMVARAGHLADTVFGPRSERDIVQQAMDRLKAEILGAEAQGVQPGLWGDVRTSAGAERQLGRMLSDIRTHMEDERVGIGEKLSVTHYRRVGLVPDALMQKWGEESLRAQNKGKLPDWYNRYVADHAQVDRPIAQAWRKADNRIRAYFAGQNGGAARLLEHVYDSAAARKLSSGTRGLAVAYHVGRFALDIRWLGLEAMEAGILTLSREGLAPFLEAHGIRIANGKVQFLRGAKGEIAEALRPLGFGEDVLAHYRKDWAWWLQQAEQGMAFGRMRHVLATVRSQQHARLPAEFLRLAREDAQLADMLRSFGSKPEDWLRGVSEMWDISNARSPLRMQQVLTPEQARSLYGPLRDRGVLGEAEYAEMVKAGRHTPSAAIEAELARTIGDPILTPLMERIHVLNDQFWADAASLIFGQADRSNLQRFFNHPLLWWPASYMVKAGRWLGGILFDRAFGRDTGMAGMQTLAQLHQRHAELMATDDEYRREVTAHPTLMFVAQMLLPVTPWDMGVSLSPMTRLMAQGGSMALFGDEPADPYQRNFFSWGPFYTFGSLLPRLIGEEAKIAAPGSIQQRVFHPLEYMFPRQFTVSPSASRLSQAERLSVGDQPGQYVLPPLTRPPG